MSVSVHLRNLPGAGVRGGGGSALGSAGKSGWRSGSRWVDPWINNLGDPAAGLAGCPGGAPTGRPATAAACMAHVGGASPAGSEEGPHIKEDGVYIVSAARTPMGSFQGALSGITATELAAQAIRGALQRGGVLASAVEEVYFGNVISAGLGQAPARQAALAAGLPPSADATLVNKVCASGLKAASLAAGSVAMGAAEVAVAAGAESMSCAPHLLSGSRGSQVPRLGDGALSEGDSGASAETLMTDALLRDGLVDAGSGRHMGEFAEACAERYGIGRAAQDDHAETSWERALGARDRGAFAEEVVPVSVPLPGGGGSARVVAADEPLGRYNPEKLRALKPAFVADGTVTAANASPLTDGAAALVLARGSRVIKEGWQPLARIVTSADAAQEPEWFSTSPALAIKKLLERANLTPEDIDAYEINEAFSVVDLVNRQLLSLPDDRVNMHGGAVALGHPIGASGARILVTLCHVLRAHAGRYGVAAICNGGGGASAMLLESLPARGDAADGAGPQSNL